MYNSKAEIRVSTATTVDNDSRVAWAYSTMPDSSYAAETFRRRASVRRSITSATTAGDGGSGTFDAKDRFERADARGVRVKAVRDRVVAASASESELSRNQYDLPGSRAVEARCTHVTPSSSAAFVTLRFTDLTLASTSDRTDDASFLTGELSDLLLL